MSFIEAKAEAALAIETELFKHILAECEIMGLCKSSSDTLGC